MNAWIDKNSKRRKFLKSFLTIPLITSAAQTILICFVFMNGQLTLTSWHLLLGVKQLPEAYHLSLSR